MEVETRRDRSQFMLVRCPIQLINVGSGQAILPELKATMPKRPPKADGIDWLREGVSTSIQPLPQFINPGEEASGLIDLQVDYYEIPMGRTLEFASVDLKFEDTERNLYTQKLTFNLWFGNNESSHFSLAYERLDMLPFDQRDVEFSGFMVSIEKKAIKNIYERGSII
ncbi:MAG: hypothetical protein ABL994_02540 [Verrucomicrobiales bacterium]